MAFRSIMCLVAICLIANCEGFRGNNWNGPNAGFPFSSNDFIGQRASSRFRNFPTMRPMNFPRIPSKDEFMNTNPRPGQQYNAVYASSSSDGKTEVIFNRNGQLFKQIISKSDTGEPQVIVEPDFIIPPIVIPSFDDIFQSVNPDAIKNRVPLPNEKFVLASTSTSFSNSIIDGVAKSSGEMRSILNKNGDVQEKIYSIGD